MPYFIILQMLLGNKSSEFYVQLKCCRIHTRGVCGCEKMHWYNKFGMMCKS